MTGPRRREERGSAGVELVGMVPLLVLVTILCVEAFLAASSYSAAQKAARDAARAVAMGLDGRAAAEASLPRWTTLVAAERYGCDGVCYRVELSVPLLVPGLVDDLITIERRAELPDTGLVEAG